MKKIVLIILFGCTVSFAQKQKIILKESQQSETLIENNQNSDIKLIQANFKRINTIGKWSKITQYETDDSADGGYINYYYNNDKLEKVVVRKFGESGQYLAEYYLLKAKLSFVFEKDLKYNVPYYLKEFNYDDSEIIEDRFYYLNNKLITYKSNQDDGAPFSDSFIKNEEKRVLKEFNQLLKNSSLAKKTTK